MIGFASIFIALAKGACAVVVCLVLSLFFHLVLLAFEKIQDERLENRNEAIAMSFVFGMLAIAAGLLMGASRVSSVGAVLPAALTFIGGIAMFLITKEQAKSLVIGSSVVSFSVMMVVGTTLGYHERYQSVRESIKDSYNLEVLSWQADVEYRINTYRKALGLKPVF